MENNVGTSGTSGPNVWSYGHWQVGIYVDNALDVWVAWRDRLSGSTAFPLAQRFNLKLIPAAGALMPHANPFGCPIADDNHDTPAIAVDADGYIHASRWTQQPQGAWDWQFPGGMDATPRLIRSKFPIGSPFFDITLWVDESADIIDAQSNGVDAFHSYSYFSVFSDGTLLLRHSSRMTASVTSQPRWEWFYIKGPGDANWTSRGVLASGGQAGSISQNAFYINYPYIDSTDRVHVFGLWNKLHAGGGIPVNGEHSYCYSDDRCQTWYAYDLANGGLPSLLTTPFTYTGDLLTIVSHARSANVVTLVLNSSPVRQNWAVGDSVFVDSTDPTFDGTFTITALNGVAKTISYTQTGGNVSTTAETGTVYQDGAGTNSKKARTGIVYYEPSVTIVSHARTANIVTLILASDPANLGWVAGDQMLVNSTDNTFDGTFRILTVTSATKAVTFAQVGSNVATTGESGTVLHVDEAAPSHSEGCATDKNGYPCGVLQRNNTAPFGPHIIRWTPTTPGQRDSGGTWTDDQSIRTAFSGGPHLLHFQKDLWAFGRSNTNALLRRVGGPVTTVNVAGNLIGANAGITFGSGRFCWADPVSLRDRGIVELFTSNYGVPKLYTFGDGVRNRPASTPPPPPPTQWTPIDKTGATDVTTGINNIITNTPNGSTITFPAGTYRLDGTLNVNSRSNLTFVGTGATLIQPYCGTITDGVISGLTNFHSNMALFTPRITGAKLETVGFARIPAGTTVTYVGPHDVTLSGPAASNGSVNAATINPQFTKATAQARPFWTAQFGGGHEWYGFTMLGANPFAGTQDAAYSENFAFQHGWNLGGQRGDGVTPGSGASIHDNTVSDIWGDFVYASCPGGVGLRTSDDVRVNNNTFTRNGRQGFSPQGVARFRFDHNNLSNVRRAIFDMEPNGENQTNRVVEIDHNTFGANQLLFMAASGGTPWTVQEDINIHDNTSTGTYDIQWFGVPYVDCATTAALPACTYSTVPVNDTLTANANGAFPTIDGVTLVQFSRVLVKNQAAPAQNGPYSLTTVGSAGTPWVLNRCDDFASATKLFAHDWSGTVGIQIFSLAGTVNANSGFTNTFSATPPPVVGTTTMTWQKMNGGTGPVTGLGTGPWALTRKRLTFTNNTTTAAMGSPLGCVHEFRYISDVTETGNTQPLQVRSNPSMVFSDLTHCRGTVNITGNTLAPVNPSPQFRTDSNPVAQGLSFPVGFAIGAGLPDKVGSVYPEIDAEMAHGASFIRITAGWDSVDSAHNGTFTASNALNGVIAYCNTIGLDVILTLGQSGTAPYQNNMYSYISQYAAMAVQAAAYFDGTAGKTLLALELGNEPNHDKWDSTVIGSQKGDRYAQTLIRVFDPAFGNVRAVASCPVIVGGLGGEAASGNGIDSFTFTQNVHGVHTVAGNPYTITLNSHYDGWNSHPYCYYTQPSADTTGGWDNLKQIMTWFQTTYAGTPPLWVTEFGWPTDEHLSGGVNPSYDADCQDAADALDDIAALLEAQTWDVRCLAWFSYMNNNKVPDVGHDNYFGIVEYDADFISSPAKPHIAAEFQTVATTGL